MLFAIVFCLPLIMGGKTQSHNAVIADFDSGNKPTNLGEDFGTWEKDQSDTTQYCRMSFAADDALGNKEGKSLRLDYDVDSPNPAYNGFWMKITRATSNPKDVLSFYVKGDKGEGFPSKIKIEVKDKKKGRATFLISNLSDRWQKITLNLPENMFDKDQPRPFEEFVVVFDDINSRPKTGTIYIDQIELAEDPDI